MRFLMTYQSETSGSPDPEKIAAVSKFAEHMTRLGVLLDTGGLTPLARSPRVKLAQGKLTVTDGPCPATTAPFAGYAILKVASREEAIETCRQFMSVAGDGEIQMQELMSSQDAPPAEHSGR